MRLRTMLVVLIAAGTAAFVVGATIERRDSHSERATPAKSGETTTESGARQAAVRARD